MYECDAFLTELDTEVIEIGRDNNRPLADAEADRLKSLIEG